MIRFDSRHHIPTSSLTPVCHWHHSSDSTLVSDNLSLDKLTSPSFTIGWRGLVHAFWKLPTNQTRVIHSLYKPHTSLVHKLYTFLLSNWHWNRVPVNIELYMLLFMKNKYLTWKKSCPRYHGKQFFVKQSSKISKKEALNKMLASAV